MDKYKTQAYGMRMTLEQYVAKRRVTLDTLRHEAAWQLGWAKYLDAKLGEALEEYYRAHKKELDGTQIRASHILFRSDRFNEPISHLVQRADKVRQDIEAGKISFDEAVAKYSAGPSRNAKGDLGFFPRYGPMSEEFAKAAFELEKGQISKPVTSAFGVHLITVTDVKPGTRQWTEAVSQIKSPASLELFEKLANEEREQGQDRIHRHDAILQARHQGVGPTGGRGAPNSRDCRGLSRSRDRQIQPSSSVRTPKGSCGSQRSMTATTSAAISRLPSSFKHQARPLAASRND